MSVLRLLAACLFAGAATAADKPAAVIPAQAHAGPNAQAVAFSPDGRFAAAAFSGATTGRFPLTPNGTGGVAVWDAGTGAQRWFRPGFGDVVGLQFSRDGWRLAYGRVYYAGDTVTADAVVLLDAATGAVLHTWPDRSAFAMSRSADEILVGDERFALADFRKLGALGGTAPRALGASADGSTVAALTPVKVPTGVGEAYTEPTRGLTVYRGDGSKKLRGIESPAVDGAVAVAVAPDGSAVAAGLSLGRVRVWPAATLAGPRDLDSDGRGYALPFFSPDGVTLAVATQRANGRAWKYGADDPAGFRLDHAPDGLGCEVVFRNTATWEETGRWVFMDAAHPTSYPRFVRPGPESNPPRFAFSPDGKSVLAACNGVTLVDAKTGKAVRQFQRAAPARP